MKNKLLTRSGRVVACTAACWTRPCTGAFDEFRIFIENDFLVGTDCYCSNGLKLALHAGAAAGTVQTFACAG